MTLALILATANDDEELTKAVKRLDQLEKWLELAVRPLRNNLMDPKDEDLLAREEDDLAELQRRCNEARREMNRVRTGHEAVRAHHLALDDDLCPRPSQIPEAGLGLFYEPQNHLSERVIRKGTTVCYYWGNIHSFRSSRVSDRPYLMLVQGKVLVDPGPLTFIKARYINDPCNEALYNVEFVPENYRCAVVTLREIMPGEELFVAYGNAYWSQQSHEPRIFTKYPGSADNGSKR